MNGKDLEKLAQQNKDWAKTGFGGQPQRPVIRERPKSVVERPSPIDSVLTKEEIEILRAALYFINGEYLAMCKCNGCKSPREETQKLFHSLDCLIKKHNDKLTPKENHIDISKFLFTPQITWPEGTQYLSSADCPSSKNCTL